MTDLRFHTASVGSRPGNYDDSRPITASKGAQARRGDDRARKLLPGTSALRKDRVERKRTLRLVVICRWLPNAPRCSFRDRTDAASFR